MVGKNGKVFFLLFSSFSPILIFQQSVTLPIESEMLSLIASLSSLKPLILFFLFSFKNIPADLKQSNTKDWVQCSCIESTVFKTLNASSSMLLKSH